VYNTDELMVEVSNTIINVMSMSEQQDLLLTFAAFLLA